MSGFAGFLRYMGASRIAALATVGVALIGFFAFLTLRVTEPDLAPLYVNLAPEDARDLVAELNKLQAPYRLSGDGTSILVPRDRAAELRMNLAGKGVAAGAPAGYELFDRSDGLGVTGFVQSLNRTRALEGELARSIQSLDPVRSARVHLVIPERRLFGADQAQPTASIVLRLRGALSARQIRAIRHLSASAVEGLEPAAVSIVDDRGALLASGSASGPEAAAGESEERIVAIQNRLRNKIVQLLDRIVGPEQHRAEVAVELDLNRITRRSETYDPDGQVVRSTGNREESAVIVDRAEADAVSISEELPGEDLRVDGGETSRRQDRKSEETVNYEISRTTETAAREIGAVKRIHAAVVVNADALGVDGAEAVERKLGDIRNLVEAAIGVDDQRGDGVEVVAMPFPKPEPIAFAPEEENDGGAMGVNMETMIEPGILLLIALLVLFMVVRPLMKHILAPPSGGGAMIAAGAEGGDPAVAALEGRGGAQAELAAPASRASLPPPQAGQGAAARAAANIDVDPHQAAAVVRRMIGAPA